MLSIHMYTIYLVQGLQGKLKFHQYLRHHLENNTYPGLEYLKPNSQCFQIPWNHHSNESETRMYIVSCSLAGIKVL